VKTFIVYRRLKNGTPRRISIGRFPDVSLSSAREQTSGILAQIAQGHDPTADRRMMREEMTLGELFEDFLSLHAKVHKRSWEDDESRFRCHLIGWKNRRLSSISASDVQDWHAKIGKTGPVTANRAHALLRKMFNFARQRGFPGANPAIGIQRFRERSRERFMDGIELRAFFASLDAEIDHVARDFFLIALLTGARRSNVLGMRWEDLDLDRGVWRIPGESSKNGQPLAVILAPSVLEILEERRKNANSIWVLPSRGSKTGHWVEPKSAWRRILARAELIRLVEMLAKATGCEVSQEDYSKAEREVASLRREALARRSADRREPAEIVLERYRDRLREKGFDPARAGFNDLRIHDLRRTMGSWQAELGSSLTIIGKSLGHRSVGTTSIYARLSLDPVRASVERAATAMLNTRTS
jgi:integrase